ncbi:unnamed protein product [Parnassius apollo]|uniref:(apollo) hypothetical protein n=1 Tax=Parnassius apollo TaxID=110799 RepID=A0A8S3X9Q2_PARAO|nr:unnamed protein product [Parnassius apollo]
MSRKRFLFLLRSIRFDNVDTRLDRRRSDKFAPLREIYEDFDNNLKKYYSLGPHVTIDEKVEKTRGRCPFCQYIPSKPGKYGVKLHLMADSKTFYTYNIEPYVGTNEGPYNLSNSASDVVKRLVTPIRGSHRNIVMDNWYTSLPLSQDLLHEYGLTSLGTIRKNKPQIPAIFSATQRREEKSSMFGFQNDCTLVSYVSRKNKVVLLVSTMHHDASRDQNSGEIIGTSVALM